MHYSELRKLLHDIEPGNGRWRLQEAFYVGRPPQWFAVINDGQTRLRHTLRNYVDLTAPRPVLPRADKLAPPSHLLDDRPAHETGMLAWDELLSLMDDVTDSSPTWAIFWMGRSRPDQSLYQVCVRNVGDAIYWGDTSSQWEQLKGNPVLE